MERNIERLFKKFIDNSLSKKEYKIFLNFVKNPGNRDELDRIISKYGEYMEASGGSMIDRQTIESELLYSRVINQLDEKVDDINKSSLFQRLHGGKLMQLAFAVVVFIGVFFLFKNEFLTGNLNLEAPVNDVTLTLDDGNVKIMSEKGNRTIKDAKGNVIGAQEGNRLNLNGEKELEELVYHHLKIPYGKQFDLLLSDGTKVKLNAGSSIRFPVNFVQGRDRKVYLNGEAYFDVTEDKAHPFIVNVNEINVEVLGTEFNVSYYAEDDNINTTLVEGAVKLTNVNVDGVANPSFLEPGYQASWNKSSGNMQIEKVDTHIYTAWKDGVLLFKNAKFSEIRKKLERHFDIPIENNYGFLEDQVYTASFTNENLGEIMEAFQEDTSFVFDFTIEENKIIITDQTKIN